MLIVRPLEGYFGTLSLTLLEIVNLSCWDISVIEEIIIPHTPHNLVNFIQLFTYWTIHNQKYNSYSSILFSLYYKEKQNA